MCDKYTWQYVEPKGDGDDSPIVITKSEAEIIAEYFPYWCARMVSAGKQDLISHQHCIDDWVVVNWAQRVAR